MSPVLTAPEQAPPAPLGDARAAARELCPTPVGRLDAVWIRYTVLGMEHEQRVPLVDGPSVRCR